MIRFEGFERGAVAPQVVRTIARTMRPADRAEIRAAAGLDGLAGLRASVAVTRWGWVGYVDGRPALICGLAVSDGGETGDVFGIPWMIATPLADWHAAKLLRRSRSVVAAMRVLSPRLRNYVDARNRAAVRWLIWLGFDVLPAKPYGVAGLPFHPFRIDPGHV
jgi:hypothetical protein